MISVLLTVACLGQASTSVQNTPFGLQGQELTLYQYATRTLYERQKSLIGNGDWGKVADERKLLWNGYTEIDKRRVWIDQYDLDLGLTMQGQQAWDRVAKKIADDRRAWHEGLERAYRESVERQGTELRGLVK